MAFKYQFETILNLKIRMEDMKKSELQVALDKLESEKNPLNIIKEKDDDDAKVKVLK